MKSLGIEMHALGVTVCTVLRQKEHISITGVRFEPYEAINDESTKETKLSYTLKSLLDNKVILNQKCNVILSPLDYQLLLIEAPNVPEDELKEAVKWRVKDLVSTPQESTFIEVFKLPKGTKKTTRDMIYVVVSDIRRLKEIVDAFSSVSLEVNSINIQEMAIRDLLIALPQKSNEKESTALVRVTKGIGYIFIFSDSNLFLSRQFKLSYNGGLLEELPIQAIQLEIQRSLDYYERQMAQMAPEKIFIFGENITDMKLENMVSDGFNIEVKAVNLQSLLSGDDSNNTLLLNGLGSLGAALRIEKPIRY